MTYAPASVSAFMSVWTRNGGTNSGIVGDAAHAARPTYHNGWDRAVARYGTTDMSVIASKDYSFRLARDRVQSDAAMAADLGKLNGSLAGLYSFSSWLVAQCKSKQPGYENIREIIYSPDGVYVKRWSQSNGALYTSLKKNSDGSITVVNAGQGDSTHFWHTHISFYRDSEASNLASLISPYFAREEKNDMPTIITYSPGYAVGVKGTANIRSAPLITPSTVIRSVPRAGTEQWTITGWVKGDVDTDSGSDLWVCRWADGRWEYTAKANLLGEPAAPVTGFTKAQVDAAVKAATDPLNVQLAGALSNTQIAVAAERDRIASKIAESIRTL